MAWTYENVIPPIIPNTIMQKGFNDAGQHKVYTIRPEAGYVLHDVTFDTFREETVVDPETNEETINMIPILGYRPSMASCAAIYDFSTTQMQDDEGNIHTAYGSRQFFTRPIEDVPADQIFNIGTETETI